MPFDPDAAAKPGSGIFGLPEPEHAAVHIIPVPWDVTTSYRPGTRRGPSAVFRASQQVDLLDHQYGPVYEAGIAWEDPDPWLLDHAPRLRNLAEPLIAKGGAEPEDDDALAEIDAGCARMNDTVKARVAAALNAGRVPGLLGGDHSTALGSIAAVAEHHARHGGIGVLQIDAHMDLREAFEGFRYSHASVMWNALFRDGGIPALHKLVQVGIRDYGRAEADAARAASGRCEVHFDFDWHRALFRGETLAALCRRAVASLPQRVYISFDIDGLDPSLCPSTGTPVPGGLAFNTACQLIEEVRLSGRTIVGFDLNEVSPGPDDSDDADDSWDAIVGARILYKLCGAATAKT
ncbi:MAG: agmatinase family protein [Phycisphaerales bacterium]|nr:agmatinase family protein [Phycisphaerales bacterium]